MARNKGKRGERGVIDLLQPVIEEACRLCAVDDVPLLQRNTLQSDRGGFDICGLEWLAPEVKNCETFQLDKWWQQACRQTKKGQTTVLFYKRNHVPWRVRMPGVLYCEAGPNTWHPCVMDVSMEDFLIYFKMRVIAELKK